MTEPSERDREMALTSVERMHPVGAALNLEPQAEHVAIYIAAARAEGAAEERERIVIMLDFYAEVLGGDGRNAGASAITVAANRIRSGQ